MGKVLIIDDEKQILGLLSRIIGLEGYEVLQAATCKAGLRQMEQHSPEVVLCDVFLPDYIIIIHNASRYHTLH